jgi:TolB-like protein/DNA-binding winged helix-turn-helix (wHTH) protein/lipopolysaccharide biosynthesis regulator YciM
MHDAGESKDFRFGVFQVDLRSGELRKKGARIKLQDKPFLLLVALLERPGEVLTRDELRLRLWGDQTFVDFERSLNIAVNKLRAALGDSAESPRFIETLPRRGYRFIAPVTVDHRGSEFDDEPTNEKRHTPQIPVASAATDSAEDRKPDSRRSAARRPMLIGGLGGAAVAIALFVFIHVTTNRASSDPNGIESIAVLPLEDLSAEPDQEYLADGMTDALITELGKIGTLRVLSRTSILAYKGSKKSLAAIGRELQADAVVEGTIVRSGNRLRITAQLVHAASDRQLWSQAFERDLHDVLTLYADVAEAIGSGIHAKIDRARTTAVRAGRIDPEAWTFYMKGRYFWVRGGADNLRRARDYFQQAIEKQSDYALAYAGLADAYLLLAYNGVSSPAELVPRAKQAALRALELDESLAEAHTSLAGIACTFEADWSAAERAYRRALEINPNYVIAHQWWGLTLAGLGRHTEADAEMRRALAIDPVSLRVGNAAAHALYLARRYSEAVAKYRETLELDPNYVPALIGLGRAYTALGQEHESLRLLEHATVSANRAPPSLAALGYAYGVFGHKDAALKTLTELRERSKQSYVSAVDSALVYIGLAESDRALVELQRAAEQRLSSLWSLRTAAEYDSLRRHPRFAELLQRVNLH